MASKAEEYVRDALESGRLTAAHIVELVKDFQESYGLTVDGMPGPNTLGVLEGHMREEAPAPLVLRSPMPVLKDGRKAVVTSSFKPSDRPDHKGLDFFYPWRPGDQPDFVGDKGCAGWVKPLDPTKPRQPKWVVPYFTPAIAAAAGRVQIAGKIGTGYRVWIDHGNGWRTGYFHLLGLNVAVGDVVTAGQSVGMIGDNPQDHDGRHLHFELSPVDRYAPVDPTQYIKGA